MTGTVPASRSRSNSGDSPIVERASHTLPAKAAPTKNGMRHAQAVEVRLGHRPTVSAETPTARSAPTSLAAEAEEAISPRRSGRAPSSR